MSGDARRRLVRLLVRRRAGLFVGTAILAIVVPVVASTPVRAIPAVAAAVTADDGVGLGVVVPWGGGGMLSLGALLGLLVGIGLFAAVLSLLQGMLVARLNARLAADVRIRLTEHLLRQPPSYHQRVGPGPLLGALTADAEMIALHLGNLLPAAFGVVSGAIVWSLTLGGGLTGAGVATGAAALVVGAVFVVLGVTNGLAARLTGRRAGSSQVQAQQARDAALGAITETLGAADEIQANAAEEEETERLATKISEMAARQERVAAWGTLGGSLTQVVVVVAVPALVVTATLLDAPAAALAVVLPSLTFLQAAIGSATGLWTQVRMTRPSLDRAAELLAEKPGIVDPAGARPLLEVRGALRFRELRFAYPGAEKAVLDGADFEVAAGRTVAIVGDGGSGKSTLLKLLLRFHDPDAGAVTLDGRDVRDVPLRELRRRVAMLGQHSRLFARSVRENLRMGAGTVSDEKLRAACRTAAAEPLLAKLGGGLDAAVDPGAANLSGSERRRLALARVLARDPAVLLLDEPEVGLPQAMAEQLLKDVRAAASGRTCLMVTHRPDLLEADEVVFLSGGRVAARGTHDELARTCEPYGKLLARRREGAGEGGGA
ncbi:MAG: ABC transporter ATP-binding protein [Acidobacteria bacterium]|nr:ABC transporter ATP-binding protein [Acidobacteriota bacterium]